MEAADKEEASAGEVGLRGIEWRRISGSTSAASSLVLGSGDLVVGVGGGEFGDETADRLLGFEEEEGSLCRRQSPC